MVRQHGCRWDCQCPNRPSPLFIEQLDPFCSSLVPAESTSTTDPTSSFSSHNVTGKCYSIRSERNAKILPFLIIKKHNSVIKTNEIRVNGIDKEWSFRAKLFSMLSIGLYSIKHSTACTFSCREWYSAKVRIKTILSCVLPMEFAKQGRPRYGLV